MLILQENGDHWQTVLGKQQIVYSKALHVTDVETFQHYQLKLVFNNSVTGVVDLSNALWREMFEPLSDLLLFSPVQLDQELVTVSWPNGVDLAPEFLYDLIQPITAIFAFPAPAGMNRV